MLSPMLPEQTYYRSFFGDFIATFSNMPDQKYVRGEAKDTHCIQL